MLKRFSGTMHVVNGVATTSNLIASLDAGSLSANGSVNLVDQSLNIRMTAVLASGVSQIVGGTSAGGFLNTALANKNGELVLPVIVTGTIAHPVFAPDVQAMAKMKLNNLLPTTGDPSKLTSGVPGLRGILGNAPARATNPQAQNKNQQSQNRWAHFTAIVEKEKTVVRLITSAKILAFHLFWFFEAEYPKHGRSDVLQCAAFPELHRSVCH